MEKDIDRVPKNNETDIVIRIDDFGGKRGVTIREFVKSDRYTGFTKAGTRIPADKFKIFKAAINMIDEKDLEGTPDAPSEEMQQRQVSYNASRKFEKKIDNDFGGKFEKKPTKKAKVEIDDIDYDDVAM